MGEMNLRNLMVGKKKFEVRTLPRSPNKIELKALQPPDRQKQAKLIKHQAIIPRGYTFPEGPQNSIFDFSAGGLKDPNRQMQLFDLAGNTNLNQHGYPGPIFPKYGSITHNHPSSSSGQNIAQRPIFFPPHETNRSRKKGPPCPLLSKDYRSKKSHTQIQNGRREGIWRWRRKILAIRGRKERE